MGHTNVELKGVGATNEEAKANLKAAIKDYKQKMSEGKFLVQKGTVKSPGMEFRRDNNSGKVRLVMNKERVVPILGKP